MEYFTSDPHYGHVNIIRYCDRPFRDLDHMREELIARWNAVVQPNDTVYVLGDFALGGSDHKPLVFNRLMGKKILIEGNHDNGVTRNLGWARVDKRADLSLDGKRLHLVHNPAHAQPVAPEFGNTIILHGHLHGMADLHPFEKKWNFPYVDVGVDCWDYRPIRLDRITYWLETGIGRPGPARTTKSPEGESV